MSPRRKPRRRAKRRPNPFSRAEVRSRLERLRAEMKRRKLGGMLISSVASVRYISGFTGDSSVALVTRRGQYLITDFRYEEEAAITAPLFKALVHRRGLTDLVDRTARRLKTRRLGIEEHVLTAAQQRAIRSGRTLVPTKFLLERLRAVKSPAEAAVIREAVRAAERGLRSSLRRMRAAPDERAAAAELRYALCRRAGAQDQAFESIVAEGPRGSLPHARPTDRPIGRNSLLLVDWGARCGFYHSDLTRVVALGRIPKLFGRLVRVVRDAQLAAMEAIRPGVAARDVDAAARRVIARAGYAKRFGHGLGHGLGLEVHEFPRVAPRSEGRLEPGMIFTVEPGIYLPGRFGIRLEDDVLVTDTGYEVLSSLPHDARLEGD
ncbi:MAG: M24 family metallopeptidase [Planctomycetota bacterium]